MGINIEYEILKRVNLEAALEIKKMLDEDHKDSQLFEYRAIASGWTHVRHNYADGTEIHRWLQQNCQGRFESKARLCHGGQVMFEFDCDATLFLLRWGKHGRARNQKKTVGSIYQYLERIHNMDCRS